MEHGSSIVALSFERAILGRLTTGGSEPYVLTQLHIPALRLILRKVINGPAALAEVHRTLQLITAFESELASPSVAATLSELLRGEPKARLLIRTRILRSRGIDGARSFREREGREEALRAPQIDTKPPKASLPLASLWDAANGIQGTRRGGTRSR